MILRVRARDSAMNIFASCLAAPDVAWRIATEWAEQCPGLTVEVVNAVPGLRLLGHHHSFQPYALLHDDGIPYYVGYRCEGCGEAGYVVP